MTTRTQPTVLVVDDEAELRATIAEGLTAEGFSVAEAADAAEAHERLKAFAYDALVVDASRPGSRCLFCVADVSGKGIAASLLMSNIQATLRALLGREASLAELARCINELLYTNTPGNKYATAVFLTTEPSTGESHYVSAGHTEALVLKRSGALLRFGATGLALGLFAGVSYEEEQFVLEPGDVAALYSDGISEAQDEAEEEYGTERLIASLRRHAGGSAEAIVQGVIDDLDAFVGDAAQHDDITLLVVKRDDS